jgi:hypothetical protein
VKKIEVRRERGSVVAKKYIYIYIYDLASNTKFTFKHQILLDVQNYFYS